MFTLSIEANEEELLSKFGGLGFLVFEVEEAGRQAYYTLSFGGGITPTGAVANVNNANSISAAGSITPSGNIAQLLRGDDSGEGSITPSGSVSLVIVGYNVILSTDSDGNPNEIVPVGDLILAISKALAGGITPSGSLLIASNMHVVSGGIAPSGAIVSNTVSTPTAGSGAGSRRRRR